MRIKVGRKVYDTEKSEEVARNLVSFFGDARGYEEILYHKKDDEFFLYGQGGEQSVYAEAKIVALKPEETFDWLASLLGENEAVEMISKFTEKNKSKQKI